MAVQTAAGIRQPVAQRGDGQLQVRVVLGAKLGIQFYRAAARGEFELAVDYLVR